MCVSFQIPARHLLYLSRSDGPYQPFVQEYPCLDGLEPDDG